MEYLPYISVSLNRKGVLDIDAVKGCEQGMAAYPDGGCYGLCYAAKLARSYGFDFTKSVSRMAEHNNRDGLRQIPLFDLPGIGGPTAIANTVKRHPLTWFRIGTMGDPSHDWPLTLELCEWLGSLRIPVVVTKHWAAIPDNLLPRFAKCRTVVNTSISALDSEGERTYRLGEFNRLRDNGLYSVLRVVSCRFGDTENGRKWEGIQRGLFNNYPVIDNPLRIPRTDPRVVSGDIITEKHTDLGGGSYISICNPKTYIGTCQDCPEQCGVSFFHNLK